MYTDAFNAKKNNLSLLLRRAICSMELKKYDTALEDIDRLLDSDFENSEALYFKGLIFNKQRTSPLTQAAPTTPSSATSRPSSTTLTSGQ
jgi:tetratricopeptide (TPR) repeat protein